jgi:hypothetical protein
MQPSAPIQDAQPSATPPTQNGDADQYQVADPTATPAPQQGAPTPQSGQPQPVDPSVQAQNPQVSQQVQNPGQPQSAPQWNNTPPAVSPNPHASRLLATARAMFPGFVHTTYADDGTPTRTEVPLTGKQIGLAIALEALTGGLAGAGAHGTGATGQAAAAGLAQGKAIAQQHQDQQDDLDKQAQQDMKNKQQAVINQLQTKQLAQTLGRQSLADAQDSVKADSDMWTQAQDNPTSILAQGLSHDDVYAQLAKLPPGTAQVLMTSAHPRIDPKTGNPVYQTPMGTVTSADTPGAYPAPDFTYALVKADGKVSPVGDDGNFKPEYQKASDRGFIAINGQPGKLPTNYQMSNTQAQAALRSSQTADAVQDDVNQSRASLGLQPMNINADLKSDPNVRGALTVYNAALNTYGGNHAKAMQAVQQSKYAQAASTINNWYGGRQATDTIDAKDDALHFDNNVMANPQMLSDPKNLAAARASSNPKVKALGDAQFKQNQKDAAQSEFSKSQAEEQGKLPGEIELAQIKANNNGAATPDAIKQTSDAVANGTLTLDTITDRPTRSKVERQLAIDHPNLDQNSVTLTPDERKKKQLANADLLNLGVIKDVLTRKPQLVGAIAGRVTNGVWAVGTNDPDLERLKLAYDNYALPAVGIHGSRSVVNKQEAIDVLSNHNKNGAQAVLAGVKDAQNSANVFANQGTPRGKNGSTYIVIPKPTTQGQVIDGPTVQKYITKYGSPAAARAAAMNDGYTLPTAGSK